MGEFEQKIAELRHGINVTVTLTNGKEITGVVVDVNEDYIVLKEGERSKAIKTLMIGMLDIPDDEPLKLSVGTENIIFSQNLPSASSTLLRSPASTTNHDTTYNSPDMRAQ